MEAVDGREQVEVWQWRNGKGVKNSWEEEMCKQLQDFLFSIARKIASSSDLEPKPVSRRMCARGLRASQRPGLRGSPRGGG